MREQIFELVRDSVLELNEELSYPELASPQEATVLYGGETGLDSLSLVSLIVALEGRVGDAMGKPVVLADEKAMSERSSPYRTVASLTDFICGRLGNGE
jgi:acyl carrier protein